MSIEEVSTILQETIRVSLLLASPVLAVALFSGLIVSIFQAATQINEQTLSFVPKIVATLGTFALLFPWIMATTVDFANRLMSSVGSLGGP